MNEKKLNSIIHEVLFYNIEEQINRIIDLTNLRISINNKKRKRIIDNEDQEVIYIKTFEDMDDRIAIYEVNILLQNIHLIKQWYLQIISTSPTLDFNKENKENTEKEYLYCKTVQKGIQNSEVHALKILDFIQLYHTQQLELYTTIKVKEESSPIQLMNALQVMDTVFKVKLKYLLSEIVNHYIIFWDIAKELYKLNSPLIQ